MNTCAVLAFYPSAHWHSYYYSRQVLRNRQTRWMTEYMWQDYITGMQIIRYPFSGKVTENLITLRIAILEIKMLHLSVNYAHARTCQHSYRRQTRYLDEIAVIWPILLFSSLCSYVWHWGNPKVTENKIHYLNIRILGLIKAYTEKHFEL